MIDVRVFAQSAPGSAALSESTSYVCVSDYQNPVSSFNNSKTQIVKAANSSAVENFPMVGRLLIVGAVSAFEGYCRGILSGCLTMCPISQARASDKNINLGGAIWHGAKGDFNRSAFDNKSLADVKELKSTFKEYLNFELDVATFKDLLASFEIIMQFRHAIVHADGILPGKNAVKLELNRSNQALVIKANEKEIQECLLVIANLVATINRELFKQMCRRWAVEWRKRADWVQSEENRLLDSIYELFVDKSYNAKLGSRKKWGKASLRQAVMAEYNID